jgi:hypothetical protein
MLGIIAWIRPDGRNALVVVSGSDQMASGDPGSQKDESLKVGDLVRLTPTFDEPSQFQTGLRLVKSEFWPQIVRDIGAMSETGATIAPRASNVIDLFAQRPMASRQLLAAE